MKVFSFSIYGTNLNYYIGLTQNIKIINFYYPDYHIFVNYGINHLDNVLNNIKNNFYNVKLIPTNIDGFINTLYRYKPIIDYDDIDIIIVRDADSEINERDRWCIDDFLLNRDVNNIFYNTIRDHYWHKNYLLAGMTMFCKNNLNYSLLKEEFTIIFSDIINNYNLQNNNLSIHNYGCDEIILKEKIYPIIKNNFIVYTNICAYTDEIRKKINFPNNNLNFVGNVIQYSIDDDIDISNFSNLTFNKKKYKFKFNDFNIIEQINWLDNNKRLDVLSDFIDEILDIQNIHSEYRDYNYLYTILHFDFIANYYTNNIIGCMKFFNRLYKYNITDNFKNNAGFFYYLAKNNGYKIIGTCNVDYLPKDKEIVIYYGNFPDDYLSLPQSNKIYKNILFHNDIKHDHFISDYCWNKVDKIYIMTVDSNHERQYDLLTQLCLMNAPFDKIHIYKATKDKEINDIYIGVTKNHIECLELMKNNNYDNCLFLEDDFLFTSNYSENKNKLLTFFNRNYDYDICFLAASKFHVREDYDDLLIISKQICTTSSAYLVSKNSISKILNTVREGFEFLKNNNGSSSQYCIDRYWHKLSGDGKMFIFKNKIGFQKPAVSKILNTLNINLD